MSIIPPFLLLLLSPITWNRAVFSCPKAPRTYHQRHPGKEANNVIWINPRSTTSPMISKPYLFVSAGHNFFLFFYKSTSHVLRVLRSAPHTFALLLVPFASFSASLSLFGSMASAAGSVASVALRPQCVAARSQAAKFSGLRSLTFSFQGRNFRSLRMQPARRLQVSCAAKQETVEKVCEIVKKQLALPDDTAVTGESKFASLGADSLDTVEIVMGIEEAFGVSVEEDSAQSIATVQDAADMIEKLLDAKN